MVGNCKLKKTEKIKNANEKFTNILESLRYQNSVNFLKFCGWQ